MLNQTGIEFVDSPEDIICHLRPAVSPDMHVGEVDRLSRNPYMDSHFYMTTTAIVGEAGILPAHTGGTFGTLKHDSPSSFPASLSRDAVSLHLVSIRHDLTHDHELPTWIAFEGSGLTRLEIAAAGVHRFLMGNFREETNETVSMYLGILDADCKESTGHGVSFWGLLKKIPGLIRY